LSPSRCLRCWSDTVRAGTTNRRRARESASEPGRLAFARSDLPRFTSTLFDLDCVHCRGVSRDGMRSYLNFRESCYVRTNFQISYSPRPRGHGGQRLGRGAPVCRRRPTVYVHAPNHDSGEKAMTRLVKDGAEPLRLSLVVADFPRLDEV